MRSEKEIRDRIAKLQELESDIIKDIGEMMENDESWGFDSAINRANMYQEEKRCLMWVLGEIN